MTRFIDLCDTFYLPVVNFVDNPGFLVGTEAEKKGTIRKGVRALTAVYQATVPWCSVIVRKAFGVAGAAHTNYPRTSPRYAWPSGEWGSLPIEGGVEAAFKRVIAAAPDPDAKRRELEEQLESLRDPILTAEASESKRSSLPARRARCSSNSRAALTRSSRATCEARSAAACAPDSRRTLSPFAHSPRVAARTRRTSGVTMAS